jgi:hypothetical protein
MKLTYDRVITKSINKKKGQVELIKSGKEIERDTKNTARDTLHSYFESSGSDKEEDDWFRAQPLLRMAFLHCSLPDNHVDRMDILWGLINPQQADSLTCKEVQEFL